MRALDRNAPLSIHDLYHYIKVDSGVYFGAVYSGAVYSRASLALVLTLPPLYSSLGILYRIPTLNHANTSIFTSTKTRHLERGVV